MQKRDLMLRSKPEITLEHNVEVAEGIYRAQLSAIPSPTGKQSPAISKYV